MTIKKSIEELKKVKSLVLSDDSTTGIKQIVFPHTMRVGLKDNSHFKATISGSIHHTHEGKSYLVQGYNMLITSSSSGQVRITADDSQIDHDSLSGFLPNEHIDHSTVSITAGSGLSGGGDITASRTLAFDPSDGTLTTNNSDLDQVLINDGGVFKRIAPNNINISSFNNDAGFVTAGGVGTVSEVTVGTGLNVTNGTTTPDITLDLSALTDMSGVVIGVQDELILLDNGVQKRKLISEITLSDFNNDSGFVTENTMGSGFVLEDGDGTEVTITENKEIKFVEGTGIEINWTDISDGIDSDPYDLTFTVDVSDFMSNGANNRIVTATGTDAMNAEENLTFDGSDLTVTGRILPGADDTYDLGTTTAAWKDLYLEGNINFTDDAEIDVASGHLEIDVAGDITLDADGDQIFFKAAGNERFRFNLDASPQIDITGNFTVDGTGTMLFNADGGSIEMKDGTSGTHFLFDMDNTALSIFDDTNSNDYIKIAVDVDGSSTISTYDNDGLAGNLTLDVDGDINLDADGSDINFKDNGTTRFTFNLGTTPEIDVIGDFIVDGTANITLDAAGGQIYFKDTGADHFLFDMDNTELTIYDDTSTSDYLKFKVDANGASTISTNDNDGTSGNLTFEVDGAITLDSATGDINFIDDSNNTIFNFDLDNGRFRMRDDADTGDYFDIQVVPNGGVTLTTVDNAASNARLIANIDGYIDLNATGDITLDASGDIALSADGDQITMDDGTTTRFTFNVDSSPELDVNGNFILDCSGDITLDADGGQVFFKDNGSTYLTFNVDGSTDSISAAGNLTLDASGDIALSADGDQITMDDGQGNTRFTFNLDSTPELDINGNFTIDCGGDIVIDAGGGQIDLKDGGTNHFLFDMDNTSMTIYDDTNSSDYFKIQVDADGASTISTFDNDGGVGNLTLDADGDINIDASGADINFKSGVFGTKATLNVPGTGNVELDVFGPFIIDADGDITLDADGGQIYLKDGGTTKVTYDMTGDNFNVETAAGSAYAITGSAVVLNASDLYVPLVVMNHNDVNRLSFYLDSTPSINSTGDFTINSTGDITLEPTGPVSIKQSGDAAGESGIQLIESDDDDDIWNIYRSETFLNFVRSTNGGTNWTTIGQLSPAAPAGVIDFTGQHRSSGSINLFNDENIGKIVASKGVYSNLSSGSNKMPSINESLPDVDLTTKQNQKNVYGVISSFELTGSNTRSYNLGTFSSVYKKDISDRRIIINSLGEGGIWVCNINGNLENGDFITSCEIPGYGMKQNSDVLHNYTVAKITQDCNFQLSGSNYQCEELIFSGSTYRRAFVGCTYHCG